MPQCLPEYMCFDTTKRKSCCVTSKCICKTREEEEGGGGGENGRCFLLLVREYKERPVTELENDYNESKKKFGKFYLKSDVSI